MPAAPLAALRQRLLDVVGSIYIYNEHRGYTALDRVIAAAQVHCTDDPAFLAAITSHRTDERKHYLMFRRWFERQGRMPFATGRSFGHIDHFVRRMFGCGIDDLDAAEMIADPAEFARLCRVIALTERRGLWQVEELLRGRMVRSDPVLVRIFKIIHRDEPSHFLPYADWLKSQGLPQAPWREKTADWLIHKLIVWVKLPLLFLDPAAPRLAGWPDAAEAAIQPA